MMRACKNIRITMRLFILLPMLAMVAVIHAQPLAIPVEVVTVTSHTFPITLQAIGGLHAKNAISVSPQVAGQVAKIAFKNGQTVKQGQLLYQLDDRLARANYEAQLATLKFQRKGYERSDELARSHVLSQQQIDKATSAYQKQLALLKARKVYLDKMQLRAPFAGVVGATTVSVGQYVGVGQPLVTLVDKRQLQVRFSVPQQYLTELKVGQRVQIRSSAYPKQVFPGTVTYVSPTVDPKTRTIMEWASVPNPKLLLSPGLFVHVTQQVGVLKHVAALPQQALLPTVAGNVIFVLHGKKVQQRAVTVQHQFGNHVVVNHLKPGEQVLISGQSQLNQGVVF